MLPLLRFNFRCQLGRKLPFALRLFLTDLFQFRVLPLQTGKGRFLFLLLLSQQFPLFFSLGPQRVQLGE